MAAVVLAAAAAAAHDDVRPLRRSRPVDLKPCGGADDGTQPRRTRRASEHRYEQHMRKRVLRCDDAADEQRRVALTALHPLRIEGRIDYGGHH